ncbi:MAG TPA: hypothetical protein VFL76_06305 [Edaphocola sp.]|nr:hypothetical protein [Edaphocola sp.]
MGYNNLQQIPPLEIEIEHPLEEVKQAMKLVYKFSYRNSYTPVSQNEDFGVYKFRYSGGTKYGIMMGAEVTVTVTKASDSTTKINITSLNGSASVTGGGVDVASRYISDRQDGFLSGLARLLKVVTI